MKPQDTKGPAPGEAGDEPKANESHLNPTDGQLGKQLAFSLFREHRAELIAEARRVMVDVAREKGEATVEDVRAGMEIPGHLNPVWLGAVPGFLCRRGILRKGGYVTTRRPEAHARPITVWEFVRDPRPGELDGDDGAAPDPSPPPRPDRPPARAEATPMLPGFREPYGDPGDVGLTRDGRRR